MNLKVKIIPQESICRIPQQPPVTLSSQEDLPVFGTLAPDIIEFDDVEKSITKQCEEIAHRKIDKLEDQEFGDQFPEMQDQISTLVDEDLPEERQEKSVHILNQIYITRMFGVKEKQLGLGKTIWQTLDIEWDKEYLKDGDPPVTRKN